MAKSRVLTLAAIDRAEACNEQRERWRIICGKRHSITEKFCVETAPIFNWLWAIHYLLPKGKAKYTAHREMIKARDTQSADSATQNAAFDRQFMERINLYVRAMNDSATALSASTEFRLREARDFERRKVRNYDESCAELKREYARIFARAFNAPRVKS